MKICTKAPIEWRPSGPLEIIDTMSACLKWKGTICLVLGCVSATGWAACTSGKEALMLKHVHRL